MRFAKRFLCGFNSAVDEDAHRPPASSGAIADVAQEAYVLPKNLFIIHDYDDEPTINKTDAVNYLNYLNDPIEATDTCDESETEEEDEYQHQEEFELDDDHAFSFPSLLGETLVTNCSSRRVSTHDALKGSAVVAIYYADAPKCKDMTEQLRIFDAGYEAKSLSIIYCSAVVNEDDDDKNNNNAGFEAMPKHWWALPASKTALFKRVLLETLGIVASSSSTSRHPCLVVLDPATGNILSSTTALTDITNLDPETEDYDDKARAIFQSWIVKIGLEQDVVGEVEIELTGGK